MGAVPERMVAKEVPAVGDAHADEARQDRQHEVEGGFAHGFEEGGKGCVLAEVGRVDGGVVKKKSQRDENAAADVEGQHVGHAVHQVLIHLAAQGFIGPHLAGLRLARVFIDGHIARRDAPNQFLRLVDAVGHGGEQHPFAGKTRGVHIFVRRDDDAICLGDLLGRQHILSPAAAVGLGL